MNVSYFLNKENNNLDLVRIILASTVILGHTIFINGDTDYWFDPVSFFSPITYSGSLAVKLFFFISGLVTTNSYLKVNNSTYFIISRVFRILPALLFLLLITVFIVGPTFTSLSFNEYFSSLNNLSYIANNMIFRTEYKLPGLFEKNYYNNAINGSLWSLVYEMKCYLFLLCAFILIRFKRNIFFNLIFIFLLIDTLLPTKIIFSRLENNPDILYLPISFAYGAFFALNKRFLNVNYIVIVLSFFVYFISRNSRYEELILIFAFCNLLVFCASRKLILKFKPKYDISYGIYLWGFLIQQIIFFNLGKIYAGLHFLISLLISIGIAFISFILIEKPFVNLGKQTFILFTSNYNKLCEKIKNLNT